MKLRRAIGRCVLFGLSALMSVDQGHSLTLRVESAESAAVPVGTAVLWNASVEDDPAGPVWYRFRVRTPDDWRFRTVRDYSPQSSFRWVPRLTDGLYYIEVTARDLGTGETQSIVMPQDVVSVVAGSDMPIITPTSNPLVFLYSAPPCALGSTMRVTFVAPDGFRQSTHAIACGAGRSVNVYLAGLRAETNYRVQHAVMAPDGGVSLGPQLSLRSGRLGFTPASTRPLREPQATTDQPVLLQNRLLEFTIATDLLGNVIWYAPDRFQYLTRPLPGGSFFVLVEDQSRGDADQYLREIDLAGNIILETNAARVNEQLQALGRPSMTSFHHEALRLANGNILVLAATERLLTNVQGPGPVDVIGDMIIELNEDLEVRWVWDAFQHMDVTRKAILDEKCTPGLGGCSVFRLAPIANDWLHGNSLSLTPDGNILYSARHQDWVVKIHYGSGYGSGAVIWRLGPEGDFRMLSQDPWPWFSHQHDAAIVSRGMLSRLLVFDNGNTRQTVQDDAHSRGQLIELDESTRTATLVLNADLGAYALALGSAQLLGNGSYHFNLGWTPDNRSEALEYGPTGNVITRVGAETPQYRSFRMRNLYSP